MLRCVAGNKAMLSSRMRDDQRPAPQRSCASSSAGVPLAEPARTSQYAPAQPTSHSAGKEAQSLLRLIKRQDTRQLRGDHLIILSKS